jgi:cell shape-determining protein MreC
VSQGEWTAQVEQAQRQQEEEMEERMRKQSQALEQYRQWRKEFDNKEIERTA